MNLILVCHVETGKKGVLEHLDVPYLPPQDDISYWEGLTILMAGLMLHNHPFFFKTYGSAGMPVILGKINLLVELWKTCSWSIQSQQF